MYQWSGGAELEKISGPLDGARYWDYINTARLHKAFALEYADKDEVWFFLPYGAAQQTMNHVMVYNRTKQRWHGPYTGWVRYCAALVGGVPHAGDADGILWNSDTGDDDNGTAIDASFETGAPPAVVADVRVSWLTARLYFDGQGDYTADVLQKGADIFGEPQTIDMRGGWFILNESVLDGPDILQSGRQLSGEVPLTGYAPQTSIAVSMAAADQQFAFYKMLLRYKTLGRYTKPPPVDAA